MILSDTTAPAASTPTGWDSIAASLGCSQKVSQGERDGGSHYLIEYLPRDQSIQSHSRYFTITLYPLPAAAAEAVKHTNLILESLAAAARNAGAEFRECVSLPTEFGSAAFFDYSLEEHHVVAAALPTAPSTLTLYQLRTSKGAIPSLGDVLLVRSLTATK